MKNKFHFIIYKDIQIPIGKYKIVNHNSGKSKSLKVRSKFKFNKIIKMADNLSIIIKKMEEILINNKDMINKECAFAVLVMIHTGIRVGNEKSANGYICNVKSNKEQYKKEIKTFGLTTLLKEHIRFKDENLFLEFVGKKGIEQKIEIKSSLLKNWASYFFNTNREKWLGINVSQLNTFIKKKIGKYHIKDFRTLKACLEAGLIAKKINDNPKPKNKRTFSSEIKQICESVSKDLGNTPGICKKSYINPEIFEWLALERFPQWLEPVIKKKKVIKK